MFEKVDLNNFWESEEKSEGYISEKLTEDMINKIEKKLGYKLPESYIYLMKKQNGGVPKNRIVKGYLIGIEGIYGIGENSRYSICGSMGYEFWLKEWGYPDIGIPICNTDAART